MAFTYGTVNKCTTASGGASNVYEVRFGYELVELGTSSQNPPVSTIKLQLEVRSTSSTYKPWGYKQKTTIDGTQLAETTFDLRSTNTWQVWGTRTITVNHNNDGTYSASKSGSFTTSCSGDRPKSGNASVQVTLPTVPRYTSITNFTVSKRNETSLTFNWSTADTIDYVWYSTNWGGDWTGYDVTDGTSGSFTVSNLSPNHTYNCMIRVRRKDSQLTTDSSKVSQTTYKVPTQTFKSKTETSITMSWSCDSTANYIWYSTDNGSNWTAVGSVSATSGTYTISGLSANTSYNIKTRVRRSATSTTYDTTANSQKTYQYPYVSNVGTSVLTIGNSQTLTIYNPLSRSVTVYMKKDSSSGTQLYSGTTSGTSKTFTPTASTLYSSIPNAKYGNCVYYCVYDNHNVSTASGHTYVVNETTNAPTMSSSSCADTNSTTTALTGNSSKIVLNASTLQISVTGTAKNSATISTIKIEGSSRTLTPSGSSASCTYSITKPSKTSFSVLITDSRGISTQTSVSIASGNIINYIPLTIVGNAKRNQPTDGKVKISSSGKYFNGSFGSQSNTLTTQYRYKQSGGSYGSWTNLTNSTSSGTHTEAQVTLSGFDYTKSFEFQFKAVDKLNTVTSTAIVTKGMPVFNWDNDEFDVNVNLNAIENTIVGRVSCKNLFNMNALDKGMPNNNTGEIMENGVTSLTVSGNTLSFTITTTYRGGTTNYINSGSLAKYTLKCTRSSEDVGMGIWCYDSNKNFLGPSTNVSILSDGNTYHRVLQTLENTALIRIAVFSASTGSFTASKIQVEEGSVATNFKYYQGLGYTYGKNDNGRYLKFDDGTLICWNEVTLDSVPVTNTWGGMYISGNYEPFGSFPYNFSDIRPSLSIQAVGEANTNYFWAIKSNGHNMSNIRGVRFCTGKSVTLTSVKVSYIAIGRWKL